jgi:AraC family transcriptional activator of pobA
MVPVYGLKDFSPFDQKEEEFLVVPFQTLKTPKKFSWPHRHSFYQLLWVRTGETVHFLDEHSSRVCTDSIYCMAPGQVHRFKHSHVIDGDVVLFTEEFITQNFTDGQSVRELFFLNNGRVDPHISLNLKDKVDLEAVLKLLYGEFSNFGSNKVLAALLFVFLNILKRNFTQSQSGKSSSRELFDSFKKLIELNYKIHKGLMFYTSSLKVTGDKLNVISKRICGLTAGEVIRTRNLTEAKRMLLHTHIPIGEIAHQLGFNDFSYFSRQFKKHTSYGPEEFRARLSFARDEKV